MRLEYKYLLSNELLPKLRALIAPFVEADVHNRGHWSGCGRRRPQTPTPTQTPTADGRIDGRGQTVGNGRTINVRNVRCVPRGYTVHSIYFDNIRLSCYHEKQAGLRARKKIRLRGYDRRQESNTVFLEVKQKYGRFTVKNRAPVKYKHVKELFASGEVERYVEIPGAADDAKQFLFQVYSGSLRPVILVVYEREAYQSKFDSLRITFDKNLRSSLCASTDCLFGAGDELYAIPKHFILELKFYGGLPSWLRFTIGTLDLERQSVSKYGICLNSHSMLDGFYKRPTIALPYAPHV